MLSPTIVSGLAHTLGAKLREPTTYGVDRALANLRRERSKRQEPEQVVAWRCPICDELHEDEDDAAECCDSVEFRDGVETHPEEAACVCPVCGADHASPRGAADCCLWHDLAADQRAEVARRVEAGETWLAAIEAVDGLLPESLRHLRGESPTE